MLYGNSCDSIHCVLEWTENPMSSLVICEAISAAEVKPGVQSEERAECRFHYIAYGPNCEHRQRFVSQKSTVIHQGHLPGD